MWNIDNFALTLLLILSGLVIFHKIFRSIGGIVVLFLAFIFRYCTLMINRTYNRTFKLCQIIKTFYQNNIVKKMERHRRSTYQLSSDFFEIPKRDEHKLSAPLELNSVAEVNYYNSKSWYKDRQSHDQLTPSSLIHWDSCKRTFADVDSDITDSSWSLNVSPKIKSLSMGGQSIQTIAGPLLASTRYNIDPKTYTDIRSPGLTSRLTKYATEANTKLIHQSQYRSGQFPKINLSSSPIPIVNLKSTNLNTPVKVRIGQPKTKYSSPDKLSICKVNKNIKTSSVGQVLREISLKRHASTDDVSDFIKKKRTDESENCEEEISQKRSRDESSRSEDDISIDKTPMRPIKKTKKPSCYDVLSSLTSSSNMMCGIKRKAELSRNGTSEMEKPYKALKNNSFKESTSLNMSIHFIDSTKVNISEGDIRKSVGDPNSTPKAISKSQKKNLTPEIDQLQSSIEISSTNPNKLNSENLLSEKHKVYVPIKLSERLFMKEEPQNISQLKSLIEEREDTKIQFSKKYNDEIKKSDIVMMRQTSMKAKLKSMFDAISGNVSSKINPSVVIRADKDDLITASDSSLNADPTITTLNSLTSTTSVNTSPISTSVITPFIEIKKDAPAKHVTFQLPKSSVALTTSSNIKSTSNPVQQLAHSDTKTPLEISIQQPNTSGSAPLFNCPTSLSKTSKSITSVTTASVISKFSGLSGTIITTTNSNSSFSLTNLKENSTFPASTMSGESSVRSSNAPQITFPITKSNAIFETQPSLFNASSIKASQPVSLTCNSTPTSFQVPKIIESSANALGISASSSSITQINTNSTTNLQAADDSKFDVSGSNVSPTFESAQTTITTDNLPTSTSTITTPTFSFNSIDNKKYTFGAQSTLQATATTTSATVSFATTTVSVNSKFSTVSSASMFRVTSPTSSSTSIFTMSSGSSSVSFPTTTVSQNNSQQPTSIFQTNAQKNCSALSSSSEQNMFGMSKNTPLPSFSATVVTTSNLFKTPTTSAATTLSFEASGKSLHQTTKQLPEFRTSTFELNSMGSCNNNSINLFTNNSTANTTFSKPNSETPTPAFGESNSGTSTFKTTNSAVSVFGSLTETAFSNSHTHNTASTFNTSNGSTALFQNTSSSGYTAKNSTLPAFGTHSQSPPPFPAFNTSFSGVGQISNNIGTFNQATASPAFGSLSFALPSGNNGVNGPFTFVASQSTKSQSEGQQSKTFGFSDTGSKTDKPASESTSLFQFGTSQAAQTSGQFTFSANTALSSTPSFSAPTSSTFGAGGAAAIASGNSGGSGMFSIGSGSTAPRRAIRQARRQR